MSAPFAETAQPKEVRTVRRRAVEPLLKGHGDIRRSARDREDAGVAGAVFTAQIDDRNAASCSFKIPIICSSEKRLRFMLWSSFWARANFNLY
jgi:hypothetical protein